MNINNHFVGKPYVPQSCCKAEGDINMCTGITEFSGPPSLGPPLFGNAETNSELYTLVSHSNYCHILYWWPEFLSFCLFPWFCKHYFCNRSYFVSSPFDYVLSSLLSSALFCSFLSLVRTSFHYLYCFRDAMMNSSTISKTMLSSLGSAPLPPSL